MKISEIRSITEGEKIRQCEFFAVIKSLQIRKTKTGGEYLSLDLGDSSGSISCMCFDSSPAFEILKGAAAGDIVEVSANPDFYQGKLNPKVVSARKLSKEEAASRMSELVERSAYEPEEMRKELFEFISSINHEPLKATVLTALEEAGEDFFTSTAAIKMHHAYLHGLLEHTLKCVRMASALLPLYPFVDRDLTLAGVVLHDIGKVLEYTQGLAYDKTRIGILHGHVVLGYRMVRRAGIKSGLDASLLERLEHIILSHQGELEWGAAAKAATPEAVFVSCIDNFDAKMGAVESAILSAEGNEFVEVSALRQKILATPPEYKEE